MRFKSNILRASGVTKGMVSTAKAWRTPMFTNTGFKIQPRVKSNLKMLSRPSTIKSMMHGFKTGKKVR